MFACALLALVGPAAPAQTAWRVVAGGDTVATSAPSAGAVLAAMAAQGAPFARLDSVAAGVAYVTPGPRALVASLELVGDTAVVGDPQAGWATRPGRPLDADALRGDLARLRARFLALGYAEARLTPRVETVAAAPGLRVRVDIEAGDREAVQRVVLEGARRTRGAVAARIAGLRLGEPLVDYDPRVVRQRIEAAGIFREVGAPRLARDESGLVVVVPVTEPPPGRVDVVAGYLPPAGTASGQVVGNGEIELLGPFGGGRRLRLALQRDPGLASRFEASVADPFVLGLPLRAALAFAGESRDSTFSRQELRLEGGAWVGTGVELSLTGSLEGVQPGRFGSRAGADGRPLVRRSSAAFAGVALRAWRVDDRRAPRRGVTVSTLAEQGVRARSALAVDADPTRVPRQRVAIASRGFVPVGPRQSLAAGLDAQAVFAGFSATDDVLDESELLRFGGARSLRGHSESSLLGRAVGRVLAEARQHLGGASLAFLFADLGLVEAADGARELYPGYGLGAQLETAAGIVAVTYALNPDLTPTQGKVHVNLRFGL